ncbi:methyltransferase [uncultured Corynebacterium sp.]|uniref:methyltransferase n=1 Tax=uncultured Corynebacterium sp. TaxID=159447 RepID=UPI0025F32873|nr:methyltransferase [uncultured Corynebacterium sp.]
MTSTSGQIATADDTTTADAALDQLRRGTTLRWRGDFHNGRQLIKAVDRRLTKQAARRGKRGKTAPGGQDTAGALFLRQRRERARRAEVLGRIVVDLGVRERAHGDDAPAAPEWFLDLRRAPDIAEACAHAYGAPRPGDSRRIPFTELQGVLGAWQWHIRGVEVPALGEKVYPDYGVFSPTRSEYVDLVDEVAASRLPQGAEVMELGTGTGVLAAVLVRRGAGHVTATDVNPGAVSCARLNLDRLGAGERCGVVAADLWPAAPERADVVVFNPPWLPGTPTSELERGVYDASSDTLRRFLVELADHLTDGGEGWLVLSDLAELLGLRSREQLERWIGDGGLQVLGREDTVPRHPAVSGTKGGGADPLRAARSREVTSLWRLGRARADRPAPGLPRLTRG